MEAEGVGGVSIKEKIVVAKRILLSGLFVALLVVPIPLLAAITVDPISWNVIGLDSNLVTVGPNHFPIGARVCSSGGAATNVNATFVWDSPNANINLRPGTATNLTVASIASGTCRDFFFEVEVTRTAAAYDTTRGYHIAVTADGGLTGSTPTPRELFVERLVSQARNSALDMQYSTAAAGPFTSVANGGSLTLVVGGTYWIKLVGKTATNGYEQIESFINFPNTIFQVESVSTTYSVGGTIDKLYGDGCTWENDPSSPNYRACLATGKMGGDTTVTYQVRILTLPAAPLVNPEPLGTLIYDFSGSSYHYNGDFGVSTRYAAVIDPTNITIAKSFGPTPTSVNGVSTLAIVLTNPNPGAISGFNFVDVFPTSPSAMTVASPLITRNTCGGTLQDSSGGTLAAAAVGIKLINATVAANSGCIISVDVTTSATGTYTNTTNNLFVDTLDTGKSATASLTVNNAPAAPACTPGLELARWDFEASLSPTYQSSKVSSATASHNGTLTSTVPDAQNGQNGWSLLSNVTTLWPSSSSSPGYPDGGAAPYFQFLLDTSNFTGVQITFDADLEGNWANSADNHVYVWSNANGGAFETPTSNAILNLSPVTKSTWYPANTATASTTGSSTTAFRFNEVGAKSTGTKPRVILDNVIVTGCGVPAPPVLTKAFSPNPIAVDGITTLIFTLTNTNSVALTGVTFTDALPAGVKVAATPNASTTCGGAPTWAPAANDTTLTFGSPSGASIPARTLGPLTNGSCTLQVDVTATTAGPHPNVSGFVSSTNGGTNNTSTGYAVANLTAVIPPAISKLFAPNPILSGGTSTLTFTITNPNLNDSLSGIAFTDTFPDSPSAMTVASPLTTTNTCGGTLYDSGGGALAAADVGIQLGFNGANTGTISAGESCTISVKVTATPAAPPGTYANTSGNVSHIINGATVNGNTASDTLAVKVPTASLVLGKQVGATSTGPWFTTLAIATGANVYYNFTVENTGDVAFNPFNVTDPTLVPLAPNTITCTWATTNSPSTLPALPVATATTDPTATCVVGPFTAVAGSNANTATAHGTPPSGPVIDSNDDTATYKTVGLSIDKSAAAGSKYTAVGNVLYYTFKVTNTGSAALVAPVTVADDKSTDESCPSISTAVLAAGGAGDGDNFLDPGEQITCTSSYTVTAGDVTAAKVTNVAAATARYSTSAATVTSGTDTETVYYYGPTRVFLSDIRSFLDNGQVRVQWETASEAETAGFFLLRREGSTGNFTQVNRDLVPGLLTAPQGGSYSLLDPGAAPTGNTYLLVEVEAKGTQRLYGPYAVGVSESGDDGSIPDEEGENPAGYTRKPRPESPEILARAFRRAVALENVKARKLARLGTAAKIAIEKDGLYSLDALEIAAVLGIPAADVKKMIKAGQLALSSQGESVAYVTPSDASALLFYGRGLESIYTKENIYWLQRGNGLSMKQANGRVPAPVGERSFADVSHFEKDVNPVTSGIQDPESDYWFWDYIYAVKSSKLDKKQFAVSLDGVAGPAGDAALTVSIFGYTEAPHRVIVRLNGNVLSPVLSGGNAWRGIDSRTIDYAFSQSLLRTGNNVIEVEGVQAAGSVPSIMYVNWFDVRYQRLYQAVGNALSLRGDGNPTVSVSGFTNPNISVFDVSDPFKPTVHTATAVSAAGGGYRATFAPASPEKRYFVCTVDSAVKALALADTASDLTTSDNRANYVVITSEELAAAAGRYADYWQSRGLATKVVQVEDIMDEFNHGVSNPDAIRDFLAYAGQNWALPPEYVLLAGEGSYDYKDLKAYHGNLVPVKMLATPSGIAPSDNYFADADGDRVPDMAIGRFSVDTEAGLDAMLSKLASYDPGKTANLLLVADNPDVGGNFPASSDEIATAIPPEYPVSKVYLSNHPWSVTRKMLFDEINRGAWFFNYTGHAAVDRFEERGLLTTGDVPYLKNSTLPVVTALTCVAGQFALPGYDSLGEALVTRPGAGGIAFFGATGYTLNAESTLLGELFYETVFQEGVVDLGGAIRKTLEKYRDLAGPSSILETYHLQGDPALRVVPQRTE